MIKAKRKCERLTIRIVTYIMSNIGRTSVWKELLKKLKQDGWTQDHVNGSHHIMIKGGQTLSVPVHGNKDVPPGTLHKLLKQAGLK